MKAGFFAFVVFILSLEAVYMANAYTCEGKQLADKFQFSMPAYVRNLIDNQCEIQLTIGGLNSAIYEQGKAPKEVLLPVLNATMDGFTLNSCPASVVLEIECLHILEKIKGVPCSCLNATLPPSTNSTSLKTKDDNADDKSPASEIYIVAVGIVCGILVIFTLGFGIYKWRMKTFTAIPQAEDTLA